MYKKLITLVLVLALAGMASAAADWTDGGPGHTWEEGLNWSGGHAPYGSDSTNINIGGPGPVISATTGDARIRRLRFGLPTGQQTTLTITGGSLDVAGWGSGDPYVFEGAGGTNGGINGGELWMPAGAGDAGMQVTVDMTGGALAAIYLRVGGGGELSGPHQLNLFGGTVEADNLDVRSNGLIDIRNDGTLTVNDDGDFALAEPNSIVAWGGRGLLDIQEVDGSIVIGSLAFPDSNDMAWNPDPAHYAQGGVPYDVGEETVLSWNAGDDAATAGTAHEVYFGDSADNLSLVSSQLLANTTYDTASLGYQLEINKTYYWRVDETNNTPPNSTGQVWQFSLGDYIIIDHFEEYIDEAALDAAWVEADGATVTLQTGSPVRHTQSMKMLYYNLDSPYESSATFAMAANKEDWSRMGAEIFGLWFYGDAANDTAEPLYVTVTDGSANTSTVVYGSSLDPFGTAYDAADVADPDWHDWLIDLQVFTDDGVDVTDIASLTIGFGDAGAPAGDGFGNVWFDNIRLYGPQCWFSQGTDGGDLDGDCDTDLNDFAVLAGGWMSNGFWPTN